VEFDLVSETPFHNGWDRQHRNGDGSFVGLIACDACLIDGLAFDGFEHVHRSRR
jgi:hypothetical protein